MRHQDINGKYIGDAIGYCHYKGHKGALNLILAKKFFYFFNFLYSCRDYDFVIF